MKHKGGLSMGTVVMLVLTAAVIFGCVAFLRIISSEDAAEQVSALIASLPEQERPEEEPSPEPSVLVATPTPKPEESAQPTACPTPAPEKTTITLAASGTIYAPKAIRQTVQTAAEQYDFGPVFSAIRPIMSAADLSIVTLETTTAGSEKGYGNYNAPAQLLDALRRCGVDLVSLGTERALDKGYEGLSITVSELTSRGLSYAGVFQDASQRGNATMLRIDGVQVAVLAYSYGLSDEGSAKTSSDSRGVLALVETQRMREDIAKARLNGANLVIVLPHWGTKNKQETPESVRTLALELAKAGADVILGTHPNVVQGIERLTATRSDGLTYETVVCYSLGSLLTDARTEENTAGMIASLAATYDPATRRVTLGEVEVTPLYIARTRQNDQYVYRVVLAEDAQAIAALESTEQEKAARAAQIVKEITEP